MKFSSYLLPGLLSSTVAVAPPVTAASTHSITSLPTPTNNLSPTTDGFFHKRAAATTQPPSYLDLCPDVPAEVKSIDQQIYSQAKNQSKHSYPDEIYRAPDGNRAVYLVDRINIDGGCKGYKASVEDTCKAWKDTAKEGQTPQEHYKGFDEKVPYDKRTWEACKWGYDNYDGYLRNESAYPGCEWAAPEDTKTLTPVNPDSFECKTISANNYNTSRPSTTLQSLTRETITSPFTSSTSNSIKPAITSSPAIRKAIPGAGAAKCIKQMARGLRVV